MRVEHASRFSNGKNEIAIQMIGSIIMLAATNAIINTSLGVSLVWGFIYI